MRISNTRKINEQIGKRLNLQEVNQLLGIAVTNPANSEIVFQDENDLMLRASAFQASMAKGGINYTDDEALIAVMVCAVAADALGAPPAKLPIPPDLLQWIVKESRIFHAGAFEDNPYLNTITFSHEEMGSFELAKSSFLKYELMHYSVPARIGAGIMIPRIGVFDHKFKYPRIKEGGSTWMSITPNEILTMESPIREASGDVLTLGLGMGYYAFMVAEKDDVKSVTIVEKEKDVLDLFKKVILPQFPHADKIKLIHADALHFMPELPDGDYDYCFADLWRSVGDCEIYLQLKKVCNRFQKMKMSYWIEDAIAAYLESFVLLLFLENLGTSSSESKKISQAYEGLMKLLREIFSNVEITRADQIEEYLCPDGLIRFLGSI